MCVWCVCVCVHACVRVCVGDLLCQNNFGYLASYSVNITQHIKISLVQLCSYMTYLLCCMPLDITYNNAYGVKRSSTAVRPIKQGSHEKIEYRICIAICDRACKNQPCEHKLHRVIFSLISSSLNVVFHFRKFQKKAH